ncbi:sensor histidine kinase [Actinomycetota bacterium]
MRLADSTRIRIGRFSAGASVATSLVAALVMVAMGHWGILVEAGAFNFSALAVGFGILTWVMIPSQPRNGSVWVLAWASVFAALYTAGITVAVVLTADSVPNLTYAVLRELSPADLSRPAAFAVHFRFWTVVPTLWLPLTLAPLLFPEGHPPTPRWKWVGWWSVASIAAATIATAVAQNPWSTKPISSAEDTIQGTLGAIIDVAFLMAALGAVVSVASLVVRYRRSSGDTRSQIRWIGWAGAIVIFFMLLSPLLEEPGPSSLRGSLLGLVIQTILMAAYGIAIMKHRLYGIDVIVSKSVTYLGLAAAITLLYSVVVVLPLLVIGRSEDSGPGLTLPIVATAIVAVLFEPIRSRLRRWADRLVYGDRATPHEVLSQVTAQLSKATAGSGTADLARLLAQGTGAEHTVVWLRSGDMLYPEGVWPRDKAREPEPIPHDSLVDDELTQSMAVLHGEEQFGALSITKPRNDPITPKDSELLADVAAGAGLLLRNISLNRQLEERARQVHESRRRLIAAQDAERHRLERNLHDGAQQQVVALKVKLGVAKAIAGREGVEELVARVTALADDTQEAVDGLRAVAQGIYPPLLEAEGLGAALRATQRTSAMLAIDADGLDRYSREIEAAAYFCLLEASEQARMSGASFIRASLHDQRGELVIQIEHDGRTTEVELASVADRIDVLGGYTEVESESGGLTRITSRVPAALEPV